jgi:hypothetical protein
VELAGCGRASRAGTLLSRHPQQLQCSKRQLLRSEAHQAVRQSAGPQPGWNGCIAEHIDVLDVPYIVIGLGDDAPAPDAPMRHKVLHRQPSSLCHTRIPAGRGCSVGWCGTGQQGNVTACPEQSSSFEQLTLLEASKTSTEAAVFASQPALLRITSTAG